MKVSFVIPAYNEAESIGSLIKEIDNNILFESTENSYEVVVIDDASKDATYQEILKTKGCNIRLIRLSRRSGSHVALRAGLDITSGDISICMAADGQDDPSVIGQMVNEWQKGHEIVWALRMKRENEPIVYKIFTRFFYTLLIFLRAAPGKIDLSRADFYLLDKKVVNAIRQCKERNTSLFGLIVWLGYNQGAVEYNRRRRKSGESKWNFSGRMLLAKDWIIAFSGIPLKLITWIGFLVAMLGFGYAGLVIALSFFIGSPVQGWSSVMTAILLLGGVLMMMLGIMGEYLWRTLDESRDRPLYFIDKKEDVD